MAIRIADNGSLTNSDLQEMFGMSRPNVCKCLVVLKEAGYIDGKERSNDKRFIDFILTPDGRVWLDGLASGGDMPEKTDFIVFDDPNPEKGDIDFGEWKRGKNAESELDDLLVEAEKATVEKKEDAGEFNFDEHDDGAMGF